MIPIISKLLLIHGYGIGRTAPLFLKRLDEDGGFSVFVDLIKKNQADVFYWDIEKTYSLLQLINPFETINLYKSEKEKASSPTLLKDLDETLQKSRPEIIICHSLGCHLFLEYINNYSLPSSIKKIVFIQGDVSHNTAINNKTFQKLLQNTSIKITNIYCPWDYTLWGSALFNRYRPIGLTKIKMQEVNNKLLPVSFFDAHTNGIRKRKQLLNLIEND